MTTLRRRSSLPSGLAALLTKGGFLAVKLTKLILGIGSFAAYAWLFTWQFSLIILSMLVIHESGHLVVMKRLGMRTRGIYLIPFVGAAAVAEEQFPSRRTEALVALAGPVTGGLLALAVLGGWLVTGSGWLAAVAAWFALVNLFNLLPVVPLDGGRVLKSVTHSLSTRLGLVTVIGGLLLGTVLAITQNLWIFAIVIPLGLADYFGEKWIAWHEERQDQKSLAKLNAKFSQLPPMTMAEYKLPSRKPAPEPPPMTRRALAGTFAGYLALAACLWLIIVIASTTPGAAAAMHALQG